MLERGVGVAGREAPIDGRRRGVACRHPGRHLRRERRAVGQQRCTVGRHPLDRRFTADDARIKLRRFYPALQEYQNTTGGGAGVSVPSRV